MGMLKRMKDMKDMVEAAPGMVEMEFEITVLPDGLPPYPATVQQTIGQM